MPSRFAASLITATLATGATGASADPQCGGANHWPASMTFVQLENAGVVRNEDIDFSRTTSEQIVSQKIAPDRWRQVFKVTFRRKTGGEVAAIAISDASSGECSMGDVTVYRVDPGPPAGR
jgi:hypothetical protein